MGLRGGVDKERELYNEMPERDVVLYSFMISGYFSVRVKDVLSWNSVIIAFGKSDYAMEALEVFKSMKDSRDFVTWSALINGYATNGHYKGATALFGGLLKDGSRPNEGIWNSTKMEHYPCMVDLLGRAGAVEEAKSLVDSMLVEPGISVWGSLLSSCTTHKNTEIG
ncbi:hypothetical protein IFM89_010047 [Coptis chinensis]|uniref:Pentatricopeptide repeat-containing protein n=1 Tax=Coptis chinensis TaxID=261450 RepID=A0A835HKD7_9MAGN|nr:hypothetical protein IFM89_010047 [Coptis chinensis]